MKRPHMRTRPCGSSIKPKLGSKNCFWDQDCFKRLVISPISPPVSSVSGFFCISSVRLLSKKHASSFPFMNDGHCILGE